MLQRRRDTTHRSSRATRAAATPHTHLQHGTSNLVNDLLRAAMAKIDRDLGKGRDLHFTAPMIQREYAPSARGQR